MSNQIQKQKQKKKSLHDRHKKRRKKDCMIGLPFIIAFHGDPARNYYCADYPDSFELIPQIDKVYSTPLYSAPFARLKQYQEHHVTQINGKVLIFNAM